VTFIAIVPRGKQNVVKKTLIHFTRTVNKKDGYHQRNVHQFLQSARHIIWLSHESHAGYVVAISRIAAGGIWLRQESLRHIFASREHAHGTIAVNVTWMERGFNACQTHRSTCPSIFNRFPVIQPVSLKVRHFSTFFAHFGLPWVHPWYNRGKCHTVVKRIQCL